MAIGDFDTGTQILVILCIIAFTLPFVCRCKEELERVEWDRVKETETVQNVIDFFQSVVLSVKDRFGLLKEENEEQNQKSSKKKKAVV